MPLTIRGCAPLTQATESRYIAAAQSGDVEAMEVLVRSQVAWLRSEARTYAAANGADVDDLVAAGLEALVGVIRAFDTPRKTRLSTLAKHSTREAFSAEVAAMGAALPVPGRTYRRYRRAIRETDTVEAARVFAQEREGMDPATFDAVHFALTGEAPGAMDAPAASDGQDDPEPLASRIADADHGVHLGALSRRRRRNPEAEALVAGALEVLTDTQRAVIETIYLHGGRPRSDHAAAEALGLVRSTVSRRHQAALLAMRAALDGQAAVRPLGSAAA